MQREPSGESGRSSTGPRAPSRTEPHESDRLDGVATRPTTRSWTIASWRLGAAARDHVAAVDHLEPLAADVIALQAVREKDARAIADDLDCPHVWARSHFPTSPLLIGSSVGLAILTPHRIVSSTEIVTSRRRSVWSSDRRVAQTATVMRSDHSAFAISHRSSTDPVPALRPAENEAPLVVIHPVLPSSAGHPEIAPPDAATHSSTEVLRPIEGAPPLVVTTFEMTWVEGGFAAS